MLGEIPPHERVVLVEDTPELILDAPNTLGLMAVRGTQGESEVSAEQLLQASLRMRPSRALPPSSES